jgi:glycerol-3-phosphate acyltransferase PlsX
MTRVVLDAMGSDAAPAPELAGALEAAKDGIEVVLVGDPARLDGHGLPVIPAAEVVTMEDHPVQSMRDKPRSSMRLAFDRVKAGEADAVVTAGNSGAALVLGVRVLGRLDGVDRPAIVTVLPTPHGPLTLCDAGASVDVKPAMLAQFALLGAAYDAVAHDRAAPRIGLLSNGAEPGKGTELTRATHAILGALGGETLRYHGYVEGSDLFRGVVDVVACDGFTGNVVLKTCEGLGEALLALVGPELGAARHAALRQQAHYAETGGALLAGVAGEVVIAHGRSDGRAIANAVRRAARFAAAGMHRRLKAAVACAKTAPPA